MYCSSVISLAAFAILRPTDANFITICASSPKPPVAAPIIASEID